MFATAPGVARHIDAQALALSTPRHADLTVMRIDHPSHLAGDVQEELLDSLMPVAASAFHQAPNRDFRRDVKDHIFKPRGLLIVYDGQGNPVAFRMWDFITLKFLLGEDILYLAGMCVRKDYQGQGIGEALLRVVLNEDIRRSLPDAHAFVPLPLAPYVALRTQNPVMKFCFDRATGVESYPRIGEATVPSDVQEVGAKVAGHANDHAFDPATMISRGFYGHSLYGTPPVSPNPGYAELFGQLSPADGDSMICVWRRQAAH